MRDPARERDTGPMSRREFLRASALAAAGLPSAAVLLDACTRAPERAPSTVRLGGWPSSGTITLPLHSDNPSIEAGLSPEKGATIRIYEWRQYLSKSVVESFARTYNVRFSISSFDNRETGQNAIQQGQPFDVFFPTVDQLVGLASARLLQPLNHDYLPNLKNVWPQLSGPGRPYYDAGMRYSVPYTVFSTGIGWRSDLVAPNDAPSVLRDPYSIYWNPRYRGKIGLYDDYREVLATAILHGGSPAVDTASSTLLTRAGRSLAEMRRLVNPTFDTDGAYEGLPRGDFAVHQAWSGDMLSARHFGRSNSLGTTGLLRYHWPADGRGVIGADLMAIPSKAPNPVLAHAFLNHLLDPGVALQNFAWNGYQPPVDGVTPDALASPGSPLRKIVPPNLRGAILSPADVQRALVLRPLAPTVQGLWLKAWTSFGPTVAGGS